MADLTIEKLLEETTQLGTTMAFSLFTKKYGRYPFESWGMVKNFIMGRQETKMPTTSALCASMIFLWQKNGWLDRGMKWCGITTFFVMLFVAPGFPQSGQALYLDGDGDWMEVSDPSEIMDLKNMTVEVWVKIHEFQGNAGILALGDTRSERFGLTHTAYGVPGNTHLINGNLEWEFNWSGGYCPPFSSVIGPRLFQHIADKCHDIVDKKSANTSWNRIEFSPIILAFFLMDLNATTSRKNR